MKLDDYQILKELLSEIRREEKDITDQINAGQEKIQDIDARLRVFREAEPEDFKVFSPRNMEILHREEINGMKKEKAAYQKRENELDSRRELLAGYRKKLQTVLKSQDKDSLLETDAAEELKNTSIQELEGLVHKIEQCGTIVIQNPIQARQDLAVVSQCLKETIERMRDTVWIV